LIGYTVPWGWTGFEGNRLWDWLELLALPVAVALVPLWGELRASWSRSHTIALIAVAVVFVAVVLGGYLGKWSWTGFRGNTLWDWMHLLLLPLLLPTIVVPAVMPKATAGLIIVAEERGEDEPGEAGAAEARPASGDEPGANGETPGDRAARH
jgi:hypothetical protein